MRIKLDRPTVVRYAQGRIYRKGVHRRLIYREPRMIDLVRFDSDLYSGDFKLEPTRVACDLCFGDADYFW